MKEQSGSSHLSSRLPARAINVTREMCRERAQEIAREAGRSISEVRWEDYFQAKRELTGENDPDRQDAILDGAGSTVTRTGLLAINILQMAQ